MSRLLLTALLATLPYQLFAKPKTIDFSMVISGGVSLGAYEAGYNWSVIKLLSTISHKDATLLPQLRSVSGASAGSINATLTALYWCQKEDVPLHNTIEDNLFYQTWVNLDIKDLIVKESETENKSTLFTRKALQRKADNIMRHMRRPIFQKNCQVPLGISVTKVSPVIEEVSGIKIKKQHFAVPLTLEEEGGTMVVKNNPIRSATDSYIAIPGIEKDRTKLIDLLFASSAFPGAFQQVKLTYSYKGKVDSGYFIDGGAYDNIPLQLAMDLSPEASHFLFIDPHHMRKEKKQNRMQDEQMPVGFLNTNLLPLFNTIEIYQSMKLYETINRYFRNNSRYTLMLSSRYHPLTGKFLSNFGAFLDRNFREYDYFVGVYDAIYDLAKSMREKGAYPHQTQKSLMKHFKQILRIDAHPNAKSAYTMLYNAEFAHKLPQPKGKFATIYRAFDLQKSDETRYDMASFKSFLKRLDLRYLPHSRKSFLNYAQKDIDHWYKKPLRYIINRIATLENERAKIYPEHETVAKATDISAWVGNSFLHDKIGFDLLPLAIPQTQERAYWWLKLFPGEIASDLANGGLSFGYSAYYHLNKPFISGIQLKGSYVVSDNTNNFIRADLNLFKGYDDFMTFGAGMSFFGNTEGEFYDKESAYGFNLFVDFSDIFRFTYVHREGVKEDDAFYFGIENIPGLIYWLKR